LKVSSSVFADRISGEEKKAVGSGGASVFCKRAFQIEHASWACPSPTSVRCGSGPHVNVPSPVRSDQCASHSFVPYCKAKEVVDQHTNARVYLKREWYHLCLCYVMMAFTMSSCVNYLVVLLCLRRLCIERCRASLSAQSFNFRQTREGKRLTLDLFKYTSPCLVGLEAKIRRNGWQRFTIDGWIRVHKDAWLCLFLQSSH
jgi:hypothetical protein